MEDSSKGEKQFLTRKEGRVFLGRGTKDQAPKNDKNEPQLSPAIIITTPA